MYGIAFQTQNTTYPLLMYGIALALSFGLLQNSYLKDFENDVIDDANEKLLIF